MAKGERLARRIEAGAVTVNDAQINYVALELPMGGWKSSGLGTRHGADGHPQVHEEAGARGHPLRAQAGPAHAALLARKRTKLIQRMITFVNRR